MISVDAAKNLINERCKPLNTRLTDLYQAYDHILAEDLYTFVDSPPFHNSAMDGYAFRYEELNKVSKLIVVGEIPAGTTGEKTEEPFAAYRIFTGAAMPPGFDTVVMQEKVEVIENEIVIKDDAIKSGQNVRLQGSQIKKGALAIKAGVRINAGVASYLAGLGFAEIPVFPKAKVSIISTGNELLPPGSALLPGKIFESNTYALHGALLALGSEAPKIFRVQDDFETIRQTILSCFAQSDMIILSGGVSVGKYDFVASALEACGVETIFHKIKQKPGKPLYFGMKNNIPVFGLPGNPASLLTCFYEYVLPAVKILTGNEASSHNLIYLPLQNGYKKKPGLTHFLKGKLLAQNKSVEILDAQESYLMRSFASADCIVVIPENQTELHPGELVEVHVL